MENKFKGYRVPKTLKLRQIEIRDLKSIPKQLDTENNYYFFINLENGKWAIPQKCSVIPEQEVIVINSIHNYIINHYGYDKPKKVNVLAELLPIAKEYYSLVHTFDNIKEIETERKLKAKEKRDYERIQKGLGSRYTVKHVS
jgi:hypothetical protein